MGVGWANLAMQEASNARRMGLWVHKVGFLRHRLRVLRHTELGPLDTQILSLDPQEDKDVYDTVIKNMIHGPCGTRNPASPCMKNGKGTKKYLREMIRETVHNDKGYPLYRRRTPEDGSKKVDIQTRSGVVKSLDNGWVVPYSPILCKLFNAHINVEAFNSVHAIKYICKYINKESDQAIFNQRNEGVVQLQNELQTYQTGRYVSSNEAAWRLLGFPLHERYPTVTHLEIGRFFLTKRSFKKGF
ncbi:hypothetical protein EVAR_13288_1 [Eumeta japonica]|uniref:Uncharacterized protein n=1 Tax=Eumeta variegata TaxID=151549 RepID=A0A4C1TRN4_EUMVA|nr:hypothetical protein EVAR_13288_1 [Eumeta japonica]